MARLVLDAASVVNINSPWDNFPNPWLNLVQGSVPATLQQLGYGQSVQFGTLVGYIHQNPRRRNILILRHPLWNDEHPEWIAAAGAAQTQYPNYSLFRKQIEQLCAKLEPYSMPTKFTYGTLISGL